MDIEDEILEIIINARIINFKNNKQINEYMNLRKIQSKIYLDIMDEYDIVNASLNEKIQKIIKEISNEIKKNKVNINLELSDLNEKDINIIYDLLIYKNHHKLESFIEKYIKNNVFEKQENMMIHAMKKSTIGLFKVKQIKRNKGYIIVEEIFTHKRFKVIDLTLSLLENKNVYLFTRIISYNEINFTTNITFLFDKNSNQIKKYIKKYKDLPISNALKYVSLYSLYKNEKNKLNINTNYI